MYIDDLPVASITLHHKLFLGLDLCLKINFRALRYYDLRQKN